MLASTINHGELCLDLQSNGSVTITRRTTGQTVQLSSSELRYFVAILQVHGWPVAPPLFCAEETNVDLH